MDDTAVAVIGMAGRFPGADSVAGLWDLLQSGGSGLRRLDGDGSGGAPDRTGASTRAEYVPVHGTATGLDLFDPDEFGMTPREAVTCDPQSRLLLQLVESVFHDAGRAPGAHPDTAVHVTAGHSRYTDLFGPIDWRSSRGMSLMTGTNVDYTSSLLSYKYGFRGASVTVQTACSSSLVAVHQACQALLDGQSDLAVAGGANAVLPLQHGYRWEQGGPVSRAGACRPFDDEADGTVFTSGGALVLLKRLEDAHRDGDRVHAVIKGGAVNNDGAHKAGFTAPSVVGQAAVIAEAMIDAGIEPDDLTMIEGHATGTALGDPIEWQGILRAFQLTGGRSVGPCPLTAVKGNVGHLGHASGVVSLIKAVLATRHGMVPAIHGFRVPNARLTGAPDQLSLLADNLTEAPRNCGVSSFGIGGTNAHVVVGPAPQRTPVERDSRPGPTVVGWTATTEEGRDAYRAALVALPEDAVDTVDELADTLAETNQFAPDHRRSRAAVLVEPGEDWRTVLAAGEGVVHRGPVRPTLGWVFPGEGSLPAGGTAALAQNHRTATAYAACEHAFATVGVDLASCSAQFLAGDRTAAVTEPLVLATSYALAAAWQSLGVQPTFVAGRGVGEVSAAVAAGLLDLGDGCRLVAERARRLDALPAVARLTFAAPLDRVSPLLAGSETDLVVTASDRLGQTTVEGPEDRIAELAREAAQRGHRCRREESGYPASSGRARATTTGQFAPESRPNPDGPTFIGLADTSTAPADGGYWSALSGHRVRDEVLLDHLDDTDALVLEMGSGTTVTAMVNRVRSGRAVASLPEGAPDVETLEDALTRAAARVWTAGHSLDWSALRPAPPASRARLPWREVTGTRHWPDPLPADPRPAVDGSTDDSSTGATSTGADAGPGPQSAVPTGSPLRTTTWGWVPGPAADPSGALPGRGLALVVGDGGPTTVDVLEKLTPGSPLVRVPSGDDLRERIGEEIRARAGGGLDHVVLALGLDVGDREVPLVEQWRWGFSAPAAVAAALHESALRSCDLVVTTTGGMDLTGAEPHRPGLAAVGPLLRTLVHEGTVAGAAWCDVARGTAPDTVPVITPTRDVPAVAVRGSQVWQQHPLPLGDSAAVRESGPGGHYLITGGAGALAGVLAHQIARLDPTAQISLLVRAERTVSPAHTEAERAGATLRQVVCDLADPDAVAGSVADLVATHGPFRGVFHLAGAPGSGVTALADHSDSAAVRAKVVGTEHLLRALAHHAPPALLVGFSSRAAIGGQPGGGDYAAANAVMESLLLHAPAERVVSVAWSAWAEIGMAVPFLAGEPGTARTAITVEQAEPFLARLLTETLPSRILVEPRSEAPADDRSAMADGAADPAAPEAADGDASTAVPATADDPVIDVVAAAWRDLLGVADVDLDADFFESGGNSLTAVELSSRLEDELGVEVDLVALFEAPTIRELAQLLSTDVEAPVPTAAPTPSGPPVSAAGSAPAAAPAPAPPEPAQSVGDVVASVWRELLGVADVDLDADFFESGGNSLTAVELSSRLEDELGVEVDLVALFEAPTIRELESLIKGEMA